MVEKSIRTTVHENMVEALVCWYLQGNHAFQGFFGGAKWISSIHSRTPHVSHLLKTRVIGGWYGTIPAINGCGYIRPFKVLEAWFWDYDRFNAGRFGLWLMLRQSFRVLPGRAGNGIGTPNPELGRLMGLTLENRRFRAFLFFFCLLFFSAICIGHPPYVLQVLELFKSQMAL